ncbi:unnamed protein product, partial [Didymodactylos carnosus]
PIVQDSVVEDFTDTKMNPNELSSVRRKKRSSNTALSSKSNEQRQRRKRSLSNYDFFEDNVYDYDPLADVINTPQLSRFNHIYRRYWYPSTYERNIRSTPHYIHLRRAPYLLDNNDINGDDDEENNNNDEYYSRPNIDDSYLVSLGDNEEDQEEDYNRWSFPKTLVNAYDFPLQNDDEVISDNDDDNDDDNIENDSNIDYYQQPHNYV